ncbi:hypothetical protein [Streptomyces sp. CA-251251]|uniref:hypothetical protein n=1 Tax=Streptomyces sp. CA-251251 TaxID=3240063 RepID=UPI003D89F7AF
MSDPVYKRYMAALAAYQHHRTHCTDPLCTTDSRCPDAQRLWRLFIQSQDAHIARLRSKRSR